MSNNEKGITLVEVLAALALLSIVSIITWNVLIQGSIFSQNIRTNTLIQQEANIIINSLTRVHQLSSPYYQITVESNSNSSFLLIEGNNTIMFDNPNFRYSIEIFDELGNVVSGEGENEVIYKVDPNKEDLDIRIIIGDIQNNKLNYEVKTIFSKLR